MQKIAKKCLIAEAVIFASIFISGLYDRAFWVIGIIFGGSIVATLGLLAYSYWYVTRNQIDANPPIYRWGLFVNIGLLVAMAILVVSLFSGGISFMM